MKTTALFICLFSSFLARTQSDNGQILETEKFTFFAHYWLNLHHFFFNEAMLQLESDSSLIAPEVIDNLGEYEIKRINNLVQFYQDSMIQKNLATDPFIHDFEEWLVNESQLSLTGIPAKFRVLSFQLIQVSLIYRTYFWEQHFQAIQKTLEDNLGLIQQTEHEMFEQLGLALKRTWKTEKIRVDMCYLANLSPLNYRDRSYTTEDPFRIVMGSVSMNQPQGNWIEMLYFNSLMHLNELDKSPLNEFIISQTNDTELSSSVLWLEFEYFITSYLANELFEKTGLKNYTTFLNRNEIETGHYEALNKYIPKYLKNKKSFEWSIKKVIDKLKK